MTGSKTRLAVVGIGVAASLLSACRNAADDAGASAPGESEVADTAEPAPPIPPQVLATLPAGITAPMIQEGQRSFGALCAMCHGPGGEGTQLGPSLRDSVWIDASGEIDDVAGVIRSGVAKPKEYPVPMPPLERSDFSDEQVRALAAYVRILHQGAS